MTFSLGMIRRPLLAVKRECLAVLRPVYEVDFGDFRLKVDTRDYGGRMYLDRQYWSHLTCPFERSIVDTFKPSVFLDVGANYGFTALAHKMINPSAKIIAVEPSPVLLPFLKDNLKNAGIADATIISAICTSNATGETTFALNPVSSQDSRVLGAKNWKTVSVPTITIDKILEEITDGAFVFIKVDTQGHEASVLSGAESFMGNTKDWALRMEFGPKWLLSQGTDPVEFLTHLVNRYSVAEIPQRARFCGDDVRSVRNAPLTDSSAAKFVRHITSRAHGDGWCDLLITPKAIRELAAD